MINYTATTIDPEKYVLAISHPIILTLCTQVLWVLVFSSLHQGRSMEAGKLSCLTKLSTCCPWLAWLSPMRHPKGMDVHTPQKVDLSCRHASLIGDRPWLKRACFHSFPVFSFSLFSTSCQVSLKWKYGQVSSYVGQKQGSWALGLVLFTEGWHLSDCSVSSLEP